MSIRHEALSVLESHPREFEPISIPSTLQRVRSVDKGQRSKINFQSRDTVEESLSEFELYDDGEWLVIFDLWGKSKAFIQAR